MEHPVLDVASRGELRSWLEENHDRAKGCMVRCSKSGESGTLYYLDVVEEALCFGWIDTTTRNIDGVFHQTLMPRSKRSNWSELNKERCRRLERLGLMTDAGRRVLPDLDEPFVIDGDILGELKADPIVWNNIQSFPELYVRIRVYNIQHYRGNSSFRSRLDKFIENSREGKMYGEWNDGGRLLGQDPEKS